VAVISAGVSFHLSSKQDCGDEKWKLAEPDAIQEYKHTWFVHAGWALSWSKALGGRYVQWAVRQLGAGEAIWKCTLSSGGAVLLSRTSKARAEWAKSHGRRHMLNRSIYKRVLPPFGRRLVLISGSEQRRCAARTVLIAK
jgi:hypothetical protein